MLLSTLAWLTFGCCVVQRCDRALNLVYTERLQMLRRSIRSCWIFGAEYFGQLIASIDPYVLPYNDPSPFPMRRSMPTFPQFSTTDTSMKTVLMRQGVKQRFTCLDGYNFVACNQQ